MSSLNDAITTTYNEISASLPKTDNGAYVQQQIEKARDIALNMESAIAEAASKATAELCLLQNSFTQSLLPEQHSQALIEGLPEVQILSTAAQALGYAIRIEFHIRPLFDDDEWTGDRNPDTGQIEYPPCPCEVTFSVFVATSKQ